MQTLKYEAESLKNGIPTFLHFHEGVQPSKQTYFQKLSLKLQKIWHSFKNLASNSRKNGTLSEVIFK